MKKIVIGISLLMVYGNSQAMIKIRSADSRDGARIAVAKKEAEGILLIESARAGDLDKVKSLIASGVDVDSSTSNSETPLMAASSKGHLAVVQFLFEKKADIDREDLMCDTALMIASRNGHVEIARLLITNGADVTFVSPTEATALMYACANGHASMVELLIEKGARVNVIEGDLYSCSEQNLRMLLDKGGRWEQPWMCGISSPLMIASLKGFTTIVDQLLKAKADSNFKNRAGFNALSLAARTGKIDIVQLLLKHGVILDGDTYRHALVCAREGAHLDVDELLEEAQKDICSICSKSDAKQCSRCKKKKYCSRECQTKDWKTHKAECTSGEVTN